jgi:hypothetical protein
MMTPAHSNSLPPQPRAEIMAPRVKYATSLASGLLLTALLMECASAQQQPEPKRDDLDVTMQIIVDPDAKLPDEVVRRIPLPERKTADPTASQSNVGADDKTAKDTAEQNKERAREAKELGRELGQSAKDKAKEAAELREQARRAAAEDRRRNPDPPPNPPDPPGRPPRP